MKKTYTQDLTAIQLAGEQNDAENHAFSRFLRQHDDLEIDRQVHRLNDEVSAAIDCTRCGNCCRSLMINIEPGEPERIAAHYHIEPELFKDTYVERSQQGQMIVNAIPCHFLEDSKCSIYEHRFAECREFPHLHKPGFTDHLFTYFMHYQRCPIVFHVIEQLKEELCFVKP